MIYNFEEPNDYVSRQLIKWTGDSTGEKNCDLSQARLWLGDLCRKMWTGQTQSLAVDDTLF